MGFKRLKQVETDKIFTFLNGMSVARAVGGVALGVGMATHNLDPAFVAVSAATLAASDGEGFTFSLTKRFPRFQKALRIIPSRIGRILDPVADKIFAISVISGGLVNGSIPSAHGAILATEVATAAVTMAANKTGKDSEVSLAGTLGMIARCGTIGFDLASVAVGPGNFHDILAYAGHGSAIAAVTLGGLSCYKLYQQSFGHSHRLKA